MGTLSENQTQEHNTEENRPGREDLGAGAASEENSRGSEGRSEAGRDFGPVTWRWHVSWPQSRRAHPGRCCAGQVRSRTSFLSLLRRSRPPARGGRRAVSLLICDLGVGFGFGFCFRSVFRSPSLPSPQAREQRRDFSSSPGMVGIF